LKRVIYLRLLLTLLGSCSRTALLSSRSVLRLWWREWCDLEERFAGACGFHRELIHRRLRILLRGFARVAGLILREFLL